MICEQSLDDLRQNVWDGRRITPADALRLYSLPLEELGLLADRRRMMAKADAYEGRGNEIVTYIIDRNINYTNICNVHCKFCAFYRVQTDPDAYVISFPDLDQKLEETVEKHGTQILLQGGHHPGLTLDWYLEFLSHIKTKFPSLNIHGFSPSEFIHFRNTFRLSIEEIITLFRQAGLGSIPGGGGEILVDRVRQRVSPRKATSDEWMEVMDVAHGLGLSTSATMMFGHVETLEERIEHLERVRAQQDKSHGFTAFICWTFQPENTHLHAPRAGAHEYLRTQALARIYLDNFANVQSSWVTQGQEIGQIALKYGANDLGSIMLEENVVSQAGASFHMEESDMRRLIQDLGYEPRQRDNWYHLVSRNADGVPISNLNKAP